jgi:hypothetical protein
MYVIEEYLVIIVLAILLGVVGSGVVAAFLLLDREGRVFDGALHLASLALARLWPKFWLLQRIGDSRRKVAHALKPQLSPRVPRGIDGQPGLDLPAVLGRGAMRKLDDGA